MPTNVANEVSEEEAWSESFVPNAETIEAMKAARRGEVFTSASIEELMADLNADD